MAGKSFQVSIDFIGNVSDLQSKIRQITSDINKIGATSGGGAVQKQFDQLSKAVTDLHTRLNQPIKTQGDFNKLASEAQKIDLGYNNLIQTIQRLQGAADAKKLELLPADQQNRIKQAGQAIENYEKTINRAGGSLKKFQELQDKKPNIQGSLNAAKKDIKDYTASLEETKKKLEELNAEEARLTGTKANADKRVKSLQMQISNSRTSQETKAAASAGLPEARAQAQELAASLARIKQEKAQLEQKQTGLTNSLTEARERAETAKAAIKSINEQIKQLDGNNTQTLQTAFDNLKQKAAELKVNLDGIGEEATAANVEELTSRLRMLKGKGLEQADAAIIKMADDLESKLGGALQKNRSHIEQTTQAWGQFMTAQEDMSMLQNRLKYFFSLTNSIQLLKRTITSAMNTVKELDAVMTETAVVTDFTVGDMWDKLPEYANQASALGASIKDLYSATTLYYQQGLNSEQAMSVGVETMKMARIAGMDAAEATQAMTAALRGFNMEINEASATRVNDVYSELAAITAADTEQIATAMSKTASIANSANMEFETTAALLAQIIETTQEAPETAGTAMKTIIARFTEVKKLFDEGMLSGEDSEGEAIEINKIDAALRTVGISLTDFLNGQKGIDDIFLELASKWDTLDLATQRYIATTAAGSRQQSRFIAMMSNYDRTMELVSAANNSAGASQEQFDKTLDSMEAKLQKLKNAWNEFTMGLANNEILKGAVDILTGLLEIINKLADSLSGGSGLGKSIINFMTVIGALKGGKALLAGGFGFIGKAMGIPQAPKQALDTSTFSGPLKAGQINAVKMITGGKSQQQGMAEGQAAAQGYQQGFISGLTKMSPATYRVGQQGFFGNKIELFSPENYLADAFEKNPEVLYSDTDAAKNFVETYNTKGVEAANKELKAMGGNIEGLGYSVQATQINFQSLGMAIMGVGTACSLLGGLFEKLGMDELAEKTKSLGGAILSIGSVLTMFGPMLNNLGLTIGKLGIGFLKAGAAGGASGAMVTIGWLPVTAIFLGVVAAITLLVVAFQAIHAASPEGKLEAATEAANDAAEAAENAAQAYEHLANALDSIDGKSTALENLAVGTSEWKKAVQELNGEVLDLVEQYPELAKFIDPSKGYLTLNKGKKIEGETVDSILQGYQNNIAKTQSAKAAAQLNKQQAQQIVDFSNLEGKDIFVKRREMTDEEIDRVYGKWSPQWFAAKHAGATTLSLSKEEADNVARAIVEGQASITSGEKTTSISIGKETYEVENDVYSQLHDYGKSLLAGDAAVKVFTDALLSNAAMIADVSEDQKTNMMNFLNSEQIDNLVKNKKEDIKKDGISEEEKIKYAETMGYEYINGKFYTGEGANQKEVVVSDDSIAAQLAGIYTTEDLKGKMEALNGVLTKITDTSDPLYQAFEAMTEKGEGAALTTQDLEKAQGALNDINKEQIDLAEAALKKNEDQRTQKEKDAIATMQSSDLYKMYNELGLDEIYGSFSEFFNFVNDSAILASERQKKASEKLKTIGQDGFIQAEWGLDVGQISGIADLLYESVLKSGKGILDPGEGQTNFIDLLSKGLSGTDGTKLAEALSMIDITNIDSIEGLSDILKELGYAGELTSEQIALLEQQIIQATKATKKFEMESLKKEIKSMQDLIDDISERKDTDRTFTEEEYGVMTKADPNLKSDFVMTGIDEYVYVGDSMNNLINALNQNTAALLGKTGEQIKAAALESEKWGALTAEGASEEQKSQYKLLKGIAEGSIQITQDNYQAIVAAMSAVGLVTNDLVLNSDGSVGQDTAALIASRIMNGWTQYGSAAAQTENAAAWQNWQTNMPQIYYSSLTGQQILTNDTYVDPNTGQPISNQQDQAARTGALDAKLVQQEGGTAEYEYMVENNEAWKEHGDLVKAAIIDSAEYEQKIAKLADTISENADALQDSKKGTREYQRALGKVVKAAKEAFGEDITKDFVEDNLDLFKDFAKGSTEALDKIRDKIANQIVDSFKKANKYTSKELGFIEDAINGLDGLDFDIYGHADGSEIFTMLAAVLGSAEAAAAAIERMGYDVTWEPAGQTALTLPDGSTVQATNYRAVVTDVAGNAVSDRSGGGGGGGGGSKWENPYDKLHNLQEKINKDIREREQLERRYNRLIDRRLATAAELQRNSQAEIDSLREQAKLQQQMVEGRQKMMQEEMEENIELQKYAIIDINSGEITIDWELIDSVTDEEEGSEIEEYISKLEELRDSMYEAQDALEDIDDAVWEIEERGREEYLEFEERIKEALTEVRQKEIDTLEEINDSINDTNDKLLDSIQQSIDKMRQDRENEKTEEDLQEKQRRLAYLEQDTSNANAMEILELRKEIEEGQEDYTDTLIDQKISELQEQNDKAAEQREKQITLLQNQLDWEIESGRIWQVVEALMQDGLDPQGGLIRGSMLEQVLQKGENWKGLSEIGQMEWLLDLETLVAQSMNWQMTKGQLENLHEKKTDQEITFKNAKGETLTGKVDEKGQVWTGDDTYYKDVYQWIDGTYHTTESTATKYVAPSPTSSSGSSNGGGGSSGGGKQYPYVISGISGSFSSPEDAAAAYDKKYGGKIGSAEVINYVTGDKVGQIYTSDTGYVLNGKMNKYKTGGLADFTGPAWLDGTKSRPELVLNQRDTQNFIHLKDILSSVMSRNFSNTSTATENNGDITYDIDINVETMGSDYDVEQVANKVKSMINEDARYRNNNAISLKR